MSKELTKIESPNNMLVFGSQDSFEQAMRMSRCLSASTIVPTLYQGEKGIANCIVALEMANRIQASPLMVMQNLYMVHGNPGWSSKFLIACLNTCGRFTPLRYEQESANTDEWRCRAYATDNNGELLYGAWVSLQMAKEEGWYGKNGSKWKTMPELMLQYRSAAFFQRTYAPELSMGMRTAEEQQDITEVEYEDVSSSVKTEIATKANTKVIPVAEAVPTLENEFIPAPTSQAPQALGAQPIPDFD